MLSTLLVKPLLFVKLSYDMIFKGAHEQLAQTAGAYPGFRSIKQVVVFLLSTGCYPLAGSPSVIFGRYLIVHPSGERLWSKVTPQ